MSPSEIKPATFIFVARYLNKLRHRPPPMILLKFVIARRDNCLLFHAPVRLKPNNATVFHRRFCEITNQC